MVEGARLESEYTSKAYRGFESHPLRHTVFEFSLSAANLPKLAQFCGLLRAAGTRETGVTALSRSLNATFSAPYGGSTVL